jgi:uncharacterized damage-inducible protein DinB
MVPMAKLDVLRDQLARFQDWADAHLTLEAALDGLPPEARGVRPEGLAHSIWELVEHIRIAQRDILDFCVATVYEERAWPQEYWPSAPGPQRPDDWEASLAAIRRDREALRRLAEDPAVDLLTRVPNGTTQTYLRELLLTQDHAAYHIGQIVLTRKLLGA